MNILNMNRRQALAAIFTGTAAAALAKSDSDPTLSAASIAPTVDTPLEAKRKVLGL